MSVRVATREARFRPRARMVQILGQHLIRDNTVGLMELIKNGYDADATTVRVELVNLKTPDRTKVIVRDDGFGMTEDVIVGRWFEPAHGGKQKQKETLVRTPLGRLPLGEKGVGRFAAQKLGRRLELVTRPKGQHAEYVLRVNWTDFEDTTKYMDEIDVPLESRHPEVFTGNQSGTMLVMECTDQAWSRKDVQRLQASLIRLLSPRKSDGGFNVELKCPEFPEMENLNRHDILERYQFRFDCLVDEKGSADYEFRQRDPHGKEERRPGELNLWARVNPDTWTERDPVCGPLVVQVSAWLLDSATLSQYSLTRDQLREIGGISLYRDGFRVLPYGDEGDDWLGLDQRRINVPSERFGNRQVIGVVEINQVSNQLLTDKTNREGLQENQAYQDLRALVVGVMSLLEIESLTRRRELKGPSVTKRDLQRTIKDLEEKVANLGQAATSRASGLAEGAASAGEQVLTRRDKASQPSPAVLPVSADVLKELREGMRLVSDLVSTEEENQDIFLHLIGMGLACERFCHEFDMLVAGAIKCVQAMGKNPGTHAMEIEALDLFVNVLRNEVRVLGAMRYVRRSQPFRQHSMKAVIESVLSAYSGAIRNASIQVTAKLDDDFEVYASPASLTQVVTNIVDNAIYWLKVTPEQGGRTLRIELSAQEQEVVIANTGPGVLPNIRKHIFREPFVTAKPDGHGLGMFIASELLKKCGGSICLDEPVLSGEGAVFRIRLSQA